MKTLKELFIENQNMFEEIDSITCDDNSRFQVIQLYRHKIMVSYICVYRYGQGECQVLDGVYDNLEDGLENMKLEADILKADLL